ncbi:MAG: SMP-30/gluconolactonase/LRE family protein [Microthrixaceae bacterium]|nr:SMP-30/gluconolactonase/LRE family protein [Microthrixaceae bacterium]
MDSPQLPTEYRTIATGLQFPEGPVPLDDGSVLVVEIQRGTLTRVTPDGELAVVANCGGGPNGCAIGPDGKAYIANNGGSFSWIDLGGLTLPGPLPTTWAGGSIQRVDLETGEVETLYVECDGQQLRAPNDLVFDGNGGFWFTDHGVRQERSSDRTAVYYAKADGSEIREVIFPLDAPNGIGLSPSGDKVYVAETYTGRVWSWNVPEPGVAVGSGLLEPHGDLLAGLPGLQYLDSLAVDPEGNVCVGTLVNGGITVISPDGSSVEHIAVDDVLVTNIAFAPSDGSGNSTAYLTSSGTGRLLAMDWFC